MFKQLWNDDAGVVTIEYLVLGTFLALALIVGVTALAASVNTELSELARSIGTFDQNYSSDGYSHCNASTPGSKAFGDLWTSPSTTSVVPTGYNIEDNVCD